MTKMVKLINGKTMPSQGFGTYELLGAKGQEAIYQAIKAGYRLLDTASYYGNEAEVGKAVAQAIEEGLVTREDLFIVSKVWKSEMGYEETLAAYRGSLAKSGLGYFDLYLIHWPSPDGDQSINQETWRALEELYKEGKVGAIGVSNFQIEDLEQLSKTAQVMPMVNQLECYPGHLDEDLLEYCEEHDIIIMSYRPINRQQVLDLPLIQDLAKKYGQTPAQITLRWHLQKGFVSIPRSTNLGRIQENYQIHDFLLSEEDMEHISKIKVD